MLYLSSSAIKKRTISEVLRECVENGIHNIELSGGTVYYDSIMEDLYYWKEQAGLQYVCHAYFPPPRQDFVVNLASCNDDIYQRSLQHYFDCIEQMAKLDCHVLSLHAGFLVEVGVDQIGKEITADIIYDKKEAMERFCHAYESILSKARQYKIQVYLENNVLDQGNFKRFHNNNYFLMTDYVSIMEMKQKLDFDLLLDLGHLFVSSHTLGLNYQEEIRKLNKHVKWLHISENDGMLDQHKILKVDSPIYCALLELIRPGLNATLEVKDTMEQVKANYEWLNALLAEYCSKYEE
ncbi:MAG: TIM barrel protein [Lachnospiraceae bacterium]|nr:TIM barrel protein [Lachnospiraceae bacterium]